MQIMVRVSKSTSVESSVFRPDDLLLGCLRGCSPRGDGELKVRRPIRRVGFAEIDARASELLDRAPMHPLIDVLVSRVRRIGERLVVDRVGREHGPEMRPAMVDWPAYRRIDDLSVEIGMDAGGKARLVDFEPRQRLDAGDEPGEGVIG